MFPLSFALIVLGAWLVGGALGYLIGSCSRCKACYQAGKQAGVGETEQRIEHLEATVARREEEVRSWIRTMNERDEQIKDLEALVARRDQDVRKVAKDWQRDIDRTCGTLAERSKQVKDLEAQLAKCRQTLDENAQTIAGLQTEVVRVKQMNGSIEERLTAEVDHLKAQATVDERGIKDLGAERTRLAQALMDKCAQMEALERQMARLDGDRSRLARMVVQAQQALVSTNNA